MNFKFITATRLTLDEFRKQSLLFLSLQAISRAIKFDLSVSSENTRPLAESYNAAIQSASPDDALIFVHDDVWINDWMIAARLEEAFQHFDVVGVAGSTKDLSNRESWILDENNKQCIDFASGAIAHGGVTGFEVSRYGPSPSEVKLLDGVFLASTGKILREKQLMFDPAFPFHFYDMDFCRNCASQGVRMGTWPIALTHASGGAGWRSEAWIAAHDAYRSKWGNT